MSFTTDNAVFAALPDPVFSHMVNHVLSYGQSLSTGTQADPPVSTTQPYSNLRFIGGVRPQDNGQASFLDGNPGSAATWYASLVPLVETSYEWQEFDYLGETPCAGATNMAVQLIADEEGIAHNAHAYQFLGSAPGQGGLTVAQLSYGTAPYLRLVEHVTYGLTRATALSKTYAAQVVNWMQGESDYLAGTTRSAWAASVATLISDANTSIKAVTGQSQDVHFIASQTSSHPSTGVATPTIALAHGDLADVNPLFHVAMPMYQFDYAGQYHLTAASSRWAGAYLGLAYKRIVIDGLTWKPLQPISFVKQGDLLTVRFNVPLGVLTFDTTWVTAIANYGFQLVDSGGNPLTIDSVAITDTDKVLITAAASIPSGAVLRYGWDYTTALSPGRTAGARGNLRDTQGDTIVFDPAGANKPMHNWCVIFELAV